MPSTSLSEHDNAAPGSGSFRSICCGVDGTRAGFEAVRQAAVLAQDGAELRLLAVTWDTGTHADAMLQLGRHRAEAALDRAKAIVDELGVRADCALIEGPNAADKLLEAAVADDLLVVGSSGRSHAGGLVLGHASAGVLRRALGSVLVARETRAAFPASILVVADRDAAWRRAARSAGDVAGRHRARVTLLADPGTHHAVAEATAAIAAATGTEPVVLDAHGRLAAAAAHVAADLPTSLIVAAGDDAERIAEHARCSVLVLRAAPRG